MPCCRCSIPRATPPAASGRDWASYDSGWGRRARLIAWPGSPWSWRGEAGARGGTRSRARGNLALPVQGWEHVTAARASGRPVVYVLWHSRILPLLYHRRGERMALLISRHRDGSYLAELSERWGYRVVRGSSRRGGEVGLLGLVRYLRQGGEVALTPDGPRGPAERMKPGAL